MLSNVEASYNDWFLLSTTLFCCGVYGVEKLLVIPLSCKNPSKNWFINSVPLSLQILLTLFFKLNSIVFIKLIISIVLFDFCFKYKIQLNHEKSSIITKIYFLPPIDSIEEGPLNQYVLILMLHLSWIQLSRDVLVFVIFKNWSTSNQII